MRKSVLLLFLLLSVMAHAQGNSQTVGSLNKILFADQYCTTPGNLDQTCIQNAINASKGGKIIISPGGYAISQTISVTTSGVCLEGSGSGVDADTGGGFAGVTYLRWAGPPGGTVFRFSAVDGPHNGRLVRSCLKDVFIECNNQAAIGLDLDSVAHSVFESLTLVNCTTAGIRAGLVNQLAGPRDTQYNQFSNLVIREFEAVNGDAIQLNGDTIANTSENFFSNLQLKFSNGDGIAGNNDDNNLFLKVACTRSGTGTGACVHFTTQKGYKGWGVSGREETIVGIDAGAGGILQDRNAGGNVIYGYTQGNGAPRPVNRSSGNPNTLSYDAEADMGNGLKAANGITLGDVSFSTLPAKPENGMTVYCSDCSVSAPASCQNITTAAACGCTGGGTGAIAKRLNGSWLCN